VIDAFDAMVSARPYRKGMPIPEALRRLHEVAGKQFDPAVVNSFTEFAQNEMPSVIEAVGASEDIIA
jgi:HD-GYP domain-containing protein (c-di-GMP phosphodiesterase class II)